MPDQFELSASEVNKAVYVAIAFTKEDPQLNILAGITYYMLLKHPDLPTEEIREAIDQLQVSIDANSPNPEFDRSPHPSLYMSRTLTKYNQRSFAGCKK